MLSKFIDFIKFNNIINKNDNILLAVSGGVDSVVMVDLFFKAKLKFGIAHCKFGLRIDAQEREVELAQSLAHKYNVSFFSTEFNTKNYSNKHGISIQMAARNLRYEWFNRICSQNQFSKIATAHHINDSLETSLFNFSKGTGIKGMVGIKIKRDNIVRPLLFATKAMIINYAKQNNLIWHEDSSNKQNYYHRNTIRNVIIPQLRSINQNLEKSFINTSKRLYMLEKFFDNYIEDLKKQIITNYNTHIEIDTSYINDKPWFLNTIYELVRPFGFSFITINDFFSKKPQAGKKLYSLKYKLHTTFNNKVNITPLHVNTLNDLNKYLVYSRTDIIDIQSFKLTFSNISGNNYIISNNTETASLDYDKLKFPLTIRRWKHGDKFYPLGNKGMKKVSDFLIDNKVPLNEKEKIYVLESDNQIAWIINFRIDERFKISPQTNRIYKIKYSVK